MIRQLWIMTNLAVDVTGTIVRLYADVCLGGPRRAGRNEPVASKSEQAAEQITRQIQEAVANHIGRLQDNMPASLRSKSFAAERTVAAKNFVQKLSQARDPQDISRIQAEFLQAQRDEFSARAKELSDAAA